jgi:Tfp pilus assembly protein PilN
MIKINLLPQKRAKAKRGGGGIATSSSEGGGRALGIGFGSLLAGAAIVFLVVDMPLRSDKSDFEAKAKQLNGEINQKRAKLQGFDTLKAEEAAAVTKIQLINRLLTAKVVPANVLHELGGILSTRGPTMTEQMAKQVESDPNKKIQQDWDPQHVWLSGFTDTAGVFKLEGGAQSKEDVTQLSKRLAASVYFDDVTPQSGDRVQDRDTGLSYYKFTITGKVAY